METNRTWFKDITDSELATRAKFVGECFAEVEAIESYMVSDRVTKKIARDKSARAERNRQDLFDTSNRSGANKYTDQAQENKDVEQVQEVLLDDMAAALGRLENVGSSIGGELTEQSLELNEFDRELDNAQSVIGNVILRMDKLLGKSNKGKCCCLIMEIIICVILFWAVVET